MDPNEQKVLVWSADQFVRYRTLNTSGFDGTLNDAALVITDAAGNETTRINPDGTSFHEGLETFRGGIQLEGTDGLTFADGTTLTTATGSGGLTGVIAGEGLIGGGTSGTVSLALADDGVTTNKLIDAAVTSSKIVDKAVLSDKIADLAITSTHIHDNAVTSRHLTDNAITSLKILNQAVTTEKLATGAAVTSVNGLAGAVTLAAGSNVTITPGGNTLTISATGGGSFDGTLNDAALVITDAGGDTTTVINPDGTSFHEGLETFRGGIAVETIGLEALNAGVQITEFGGTAVGTATSFLRVGNTAGTGIGGAIGEWVFDPGIGSMSAKDQNNDTFVQTDASSKALFVENLVVTGTLSKPAGSFQIDHPLDPENQYLYHSFVESPDMMNVYNGNVMLDAQGEAVVELPDWFEALNRDFRYQLTSIGGFAPVYVAEEIARNRFKIAGGEPGLKVSWQVTGIRQDPYAEQHRIPVEVNKPPEERGTYLHPEIYGQPASRGRRSIPLTRSTNQ